MLREIYQYLPLLDQACLALSCRSLFNIIGNVLKNEEFAFRRLLHIRIPKLCVNRPNIKRNQLRVRLEDQRWALCDACLKLQPREEFVKVKYPRSYKSVPNACAEFAGIADLCPCLSVTLRGRAQLIELLQSSSAQPPKDQERFWSRVIEKGNTYLSHQCVIDNEDSNRADVQMRLSIESNQLKLRTRYRLAVQKFQITFFRGSNLFVCGSPQSPFSFVLRRTF